MGYTAFPPNTTTHSITIRLTGSIFGRNAITYLAAKISAPSMPKSTICRTVSFLSKGVLQPVACAVLE